MEIKIKYFTDIEPIKFIAGKSDWYDLRAAEDVEMKAGEFKLIKQQCENYRCGESEHDTASAYC